MDGDDYDMAEDFDDFGALGGDDELGLGVGGEVEMDAETQMHHGHTPVHPSYPPTQGPATVLTRLPPPQVDIRAVFPAIGDGPTRPRVIGSICLVDIGRHINLQVLACAARNVEYNPRRHVAILRLREPACGCVLRATGTATVTGCASVGAARRAASIVGRVVRAAMGWTDPARKLGSVRFGVKSLSCRFDFRHPIRLERLSLAHPSIAVYEPETFCGCHVKLSGLSGQRQWSVTASVFVSGKVSLMGGRSPQEVCHAFDLLASIIAPFAKNADLSKLPGPPNQDQGIAITNANVTSPNDSAGGA